MSDMPSAATFRVPSLDPHAPRGGTRLPRGVREEELRLRIRGRAILDAILILLATGGVSLLAADSYQRLLLGLVVLSFGILLFVIRRSRDVARLIDAGRWRDEALAGQGLTLAQWHSGVPLPKWGQRDAAASFPVQSARANPDPRSAAKDGGSDEGSQAEGGSEISDSRDGAR